MNECYDDDTIGRGWITRNRCANSHSLFLFVICLVKSDVRDTCSLLCEFLMEFRTTAQQRKNKYIGKKEALRRWYFTAINLITNRQQETFKRIICIRTLIFLVFSFVFLEALNILMRQIFSSCDLICMYFGCAENGSCIYKSIVATYWIDWLAPE